MNTASATWDKSLPEAENLNLLAQCKRCMARRPDPTGESGLAAFEYGWRAFHNLYQPFRDKNEGDKMQACIDKHLNKYRFVTATRGALAQLCDYLAGDNLAFGDPGEGRKATEQANRLQKALYVNDNVVVVQALVRVLAAIRNGQARVRAAPPDLAGATAGTPQGSTAISNALYALNVHLLSGRSGLAVEYLERVIESRTQQLLREAR